MASVHRCLRAFWVHLFMRSHYEINVIGLDNAAMRAGVDNEAGSAVLYLCLSVSYR